jgi:type III pantothenate kinase
MEDWLGLVVGNSRLHWGWFQGGKLRQTWDSPHVTQPTMTLPDFIVQRVGKTEITVYIASVVPAQTHLWQGLQPQREITLQDIPLQGMYATMGRDRALALWGAICRYHSPILVIDGGTALTFTGAGSQQEFVGGGILPGLRLQFQTLSQATAALPQIPIPQQLPTRWGKDTPTAIQSGITYTILAGVQDYITHWWREFPQSQVVFTGGDGGWLYRQLSLRFEENRELLNIDPHLAFWGMQAVVQK